jgi:hypothetical protein
MLGPTLPGYSHKMGPVQGTSVAKFCDGTHIRPAITDPSSRSYQEDSDGAPMRPVDSCTGYKFDCTRKADRRDNIAGPVYDLIFIRKTIENAQRRCISSRIAIADVRNMKHEEEEI